MRANLEIERRARAAWLPGLERLLRATPGVEDFVVHPEGPHPDQWKGDLHYVFRGRKVFVDLKSEVTVYPRLTAFYETMSNAVPGRENEGWGRKVSYDIVWYAFEPAAAMVSLCLASWNEEAEAALREGVLREVEQRKHAQANLAKGIPCPVPWLLARSAARTKAGRPALVRGLFVLEGNEVVRLDAGSDAQAFVGRLRLAADATRRAA